MKRYKKSFGIRTICLTMKRRHVLFLCLLIPLLIISLTVSQLCVENSFKCSSTFDNGSISAYQFKDIQSKVKNINVANEVHDNLYRNQDKAPITPDELLSGMSFYLEYPTSSFVLFFENKNNNVSSDVIRELSEVALNILKHNGYSGIMLQAVNDIPVESNDKVLFTFASCVLSAVISFTISFLNEVYIDTIYDSQDIKKLGLSGFDISV